MESRKTVKYEDQLDKVREYARRLNCDMAIKREIDMHKYQYCKTVLFPLLIIVMAIYVCIMNKFIITSSMVKVGLAITYIIMIVVGLILLRAYNVSCQLNTADYLFGSKVTNYACTLLDRNYYNMEEGYINGMTDEAYSKMVAKSINDITSKAWATNNFYINVVGNVNDILDKK